MGFEAFLILAGMPLMGLLLGLPFLGVKSPRKWGRIASPGSSDEGVVTDVQDLTPPQEVLCRWQALNFVRWIDSPDEILLSHLDIGDAVPEWTDGMDALIHQWIKAASEWA